MGSPAAKEERHVKHATSEDCPCCHGCLSPGLDTDRALVVAFLGGVFARDTETSIAAALCQHHTRLAAQATEFISEHTPKRPS